MNLNEKLTRSIDWKKSVEEQLASLSQYDTISDEEIKEIAETCFKSTEAGILIEYLRPERLRAFLPSFLEFVQDVNWLAAKGAAVMLVHTGDRILPEIKRVFRQVNDDAIWHYWILSTIVRYFDKALIAKLIPALLLLVKRADKEGAAVEALVILKEEKLLTESELTAQHNYLVECYSDDQTWMN